MPQAGILHVVGGNDRGKRFDLTLAETHIGRGADQDLVLADIAVSRRHVTVQIEGPRYRLRDLGSGNGTLVNGQRVDTVLLNDGDHIEVGNTVLRFDHPPSRAEAYPAAPSAYAPPPAAPPPGGYAPPPAPAYGGPPMASGSTGYSAAPGAYGSPSPGLGAPPAYGAPSGAPPAYGAPPPAAGYGAPPAVAYGAPPGLGAATGTGGYGASAYPPPGSPEGFHGAAVGGSAPRGAPPYGASYGNAPPPLGAPPSPSPYASPGYGAPAPANNEAPFGAPPPGLPSETPSDAINVPRAQPYSGGPRTGPSANPLDTPLKQALVFGAMGLLCLAGIGVIVSRTVFAKPVIVASEAEDYYRQGLRLFASEDYEAAQVDFNEALRLVPDSPEVRRYVQQCEIEVRARTALKAADRALAARRYVEALKALGDVDATSLQSARAARTKKENAPKAAVEDVEEARRLAQSDPEASRARLAQALELDPTNEDARSLSVKLRGAVAVAPKEAPPTEDPAPPPPPEKPIAKNEKPSKKTHKEAEPIAKPSKTPPAKQEVVAPSSGAFMAAYKAKDFAGAEKALRSEATTQSAKQSTKTIELANQVRLLKQLLDRAAGEEAAKPEQAAKDYDEARSIDATVGRGAHAPFLKSKIGKLALAGAQQAFSMGRYEAAYNGALAAQKAGVGDGGLFKQLETRAGELVNKGVGMSKSNLVQAKAQWRTAMKMVPNNSPIYAKAYQLLNNSGGTHKDEDED
jgi:tetratricopeptide (TPR) repeat protein